MILCQVMRHRRSHWIAYFFSFCPIPASTVNTLFATQHVRISFSILMYELGHALFKLCQYLISRCSVWWVFMGIHSTICTFLLCTFPYARILQTFLIVSSLTKFVKCVGFSIQLYMQINVQEKAKKEKISLNFIERVTHHLSMLPEKYYGKLCLYTKIISFTGTLINNGSELISLHTFLHM